MCLQRKTDEIHLIYSGEWGSWQAESALNLLALLTTLRYSSSNSNVKYDNHVWSYMIVSGD